MRRCVVFVVAAIVPAACSGSGESMDQRSTVDASADASSSLTPDSSSPGSPEGDASDGSTCGNGVQDSQEQCCSAADRKAFVDEVAAKFVAAFAANVCVPQTETGNLSPPIATGARWCHTNSSAACAPGCTMPTAWSNASVTTSGDDHTLRASLTISAFSLPVAGKVGGIGASCTIGVSGSAALSTHFDIVDSGKSVTGAVSGTETLDLTSSSLQDCSLVSNIPDLGAAITESLRRALLDAVHQTFASLRHDCRY